MQGCANNTADASSALDVFAAYCRMKAVVTTTATTTALASLTSSTSSSTSTSTDTKFDHEGSSSSLSSGARIAVGIIIPVIAIVSLALGFVCMRRRKRAPMQCVESDRRPVNAVAADVGELGNAAVVELPEQKEKKCELYAGGRAQEMDGRELPEKKGWVSVAELQ